MPHDIPLNNFWPAALVERTNSWHNNFRGLRVRWERKAENYSALVQLACAIITFQAAARESNRS